MKNMLQHSVGTQMAMRDSKGPEPVYGQLLFLVLSLVIDGMGCNVDDLVTASSKLTTSPDPQVRIDAAKRLGELKDTPALDALVAALKDPDERIRLATAMSLKKIGQPAFDRLADEIKRKDPEARESAIWALGGSRDPRALRALLSIFSYDGYERAQCNSWCGTYCHLLPPDGRLGPVTTQKKLSEAFAFMGTAAIAGLVETMGELPQSRSRANDNWSDSSKANIIRQIGPSAVEALAECVKNAACTGRGWAAMILSEMDDPRVPPVMRTALYDEDRRIRGFALHSLIRSCQDVSGILIADLGSADEQKKIDAVYYLGWFGGKEATDALAPLLQHKDTRIKESTIRALGYRWSSDRYGMLVRALDDPSWDVQVAAIESLQMLDDPRAVTKLLAMRSPENMERINKAVSGIRHVGRTEPCFGRPARTMEDMRAVLIDGRSLEKKSTFEKEIETDYHFPKMGERFKSMELRSSLCGADRLLVRYTESKLKSSDVAIVSRAIAALVGRGDQSSIEPIAALLSHGDSSVRAKAASALGALGHNHDPEVAPKLYPLLKDPDVQVRVQAIKAIGELRAVEASDLLLPFLDDESPTIVKEAAVALGNLREPTALRKMEELAMTGPVESLDGVIKGLSYVGDETAADPIMGRWLNKADWAVHAMGGTVHKAICRRQEKETNVLVQQGLRQLLRHLSSIELATGRQRPADSWDDWPFVSHVLPPLAEGNSWPQDRPMFPPPLPGDFLQLRILEMGIP